MFGQQQQQAHTAFNAGVRGATIPQQQQQSPNFGIVANNPFLETGGLNKALQGSPQNIMQQHNSQNMFQVGI